MDLEIAVGKDEVVSEVLRAQFNDALMDPANRVVLNRDQVVALLAEIEEEMEFEENEPAAGPRAQFFHVKNPVEVYFQPAAIALVIVNNKGDAMLSLVNGGNIAVEALQWQIMKKSFEAAVEVEEITSTSGLVKA